MAEDIYGKKLQKQDAFNKTTCFCWSEMGDSNSRHLAPKAGALPTALHPVIKLNYPAGRILPNQARCRLRNTPL